MRSKRRIVMAAWTAVLVGFSAAAARADWTAEQRCEHVRILWDQLVGETRDEVDWRDYVATMGLTAPGTVISEVLARHNGGAAGCATPPAPLTSNCDLVSTETNPFDPYAPAVVDGCGALQPGQVGLEFVPAGPYSTVVRVCRDLSSIAECGEPAPVERLVFDDNPIRPWFSLEDARCYMARMQFSFFGRRIALYLDWMERSQKVSGLPAMIDDALETFIYHFTGQGTCTLYVAMPPDWCTNLELRPNPLDLGSWALQDQTASLLPGQVGIVPLPPPATMAVELCVHQGGPDVCPGAADVPVCAPIASKD